MDELFSAGAAWPSMAAFEVTGFDGSYEVIRTSGGLVLASAAFERIVASSGISRDYAEMFLEEEFLRGSYCVAGLPMTVLGINKDVLVRAISRENVGVRFDWENSRCRIFTHVQINPSLMETIQITSHQFLVPNSEVQSLINSLGKCSANLTGCEGSAAFTGAEITELGPGHPGGGRYDELIKQALRDRPSDQKVNKSQMARWVVRTHWDRDPNPGEIKHVSRRIALFLSGHRP